MPLSGGELREVVEADVAAAPEVLLVLQEGALARLTQSGDHHDWHLGQRFADESPEGLALVCCHIATDYRNILTAFAEEKL
jgi:hypothetical protein